MGKTYSILESGKKHYKNVVYINFEANAETAKSLAQFMDLYHPEYAIRISTKKFGFDNNINSVPLYAVHCINE